MKRLKEIFSTNETYLLIFIVIILNISWGATPVIAKYSIEGLPPLNGALFRYGGSFLCFIPIWKKSLKSFLAATLKDKLLVAFAGAFVFGLGPTMAFHGLTKTFGGQASLLIATEPIYTAILASILIKDRFKLKYLMAFVLAASGVYLMSRAHEGNLIGNLFYLVDVISNASYTVLGAILVRRGWKSLEIVCCSLFFGVLILLPQYELVTYSSEQFLKLFFGLFVYCGFWCTVVGYAAWVYLSKSTSVVLMALFLFIQPISGNILGALLLGEQITKETLEGAFMILLALLLSMNLSKLVRRVTSSPN